jgi:hypothetical protein
MNPTGVIEGGWEFVIAAYAATALILIGYTASVVRRYLKEHSRRGRT